MARASYQKIDNIRIGGNKLVSVKLVKKNHKPVTVCLPPLDTPPLRVVDDKRKERPYRPMLHLKV